MQDVIDQVRTEPNRADRRLRRVGRQAAGVTLAGALAAGVGFLTTADIADGPDAASATRNPSNGQYPSIGMLFMSANQSYSGYLSANTLDCRAEITTAMNDVWPKLKASSDNTAEMGRWQNGISYSTLCNDSSMYWDYKLAWDANQENFKQPNNTYIGGRIHHQPQASGSAYCTYWAIGSGGCGHRDYTQYNLTKFLASSTTYRRQLIAHEQGHAHDLTDVCQSGTLMSNGANGCTWGGALEAWQPYDRTDINNTYK